MKILLIGFRGAGKSTLGEAIAQELGLPFLDADSEIEKREGRSIQEMVAKEGWGYFRALEKAFLRELLGKEHLVCALGGGAVQHLEEMEALSRESLIIWVKAPLEVLKERILRDEKTRTQRPPLTGLSLDEELKKLYTEREPLYQRWAQLEIDTTLTPLEEILRRLKEKISGGKSYG